MTVCGNSGVSMIERDEEYVQSLKGSLKSVIGMFSCLIGETNQIATMMSIKYFGVILNFLWKCDIRSCALKYENVPRKDQHVVYYPNSFHKVLKLLTYKVNVFCVVEKNVKEEKW